MAVLKMFAVRDVKADQFLSPFCSPNGGSALRSFCDAVQNENSLINKHPEDYQLYEVGEYVEQSGEIVPVVPVKFIANATDFKKVV